MPGVFQIIKEAAVKHTVGTLTGVVITVSVGGYLYKLHQDAKTGDIVGAEQVVKTDVAVGDRQGDLRMKLQGLGEDAAKAAAVKAEAEAKAAAEAEKAARAAEEARKATEEALKVAQEADKAKEAEEEAQSAEEQNPEEAEDEDAEEKPEDTNETDAETSDGENSDTFKESDGHKNDQVAYEKSAGEAEGGTENADKTDPNAVDNDDKGKEGSGLKQDEAKTNDGEKKEEDGTENKEQKKDTEKKEDKEEDNEEKKTVDEKKEDDKLKEGEAEDNDEQEKNQKENKEKKEEVDFRRSKEKNNAQTPRDQQGTLNKTPSSDTPGNDIPGNQFSDTYAGSSSRSGMSREEARIYWKAAFKNADGTEVEMARSDLDAVGTVSEPGLEWAIKEAANGSEGSTVGILRFVGLSGNQETLTHVGYGINKILFGNIRLSDEFRGIDVGFKLGEKGKGIITNYASVEPRGNNRYVAMQGGNPNVSFGFDDSGIYFSRGNPESARGQLREKFRNERPMVYRQEVEALGGKFTDGLAWVIREAALGANSNVRELIFKNLDKDDETLTGIAFGLQDILQQQDPKLKYGIFDVSYNFQIHSNETSSLEERMSYRYYVNEGCPCRLTFCGNKISVFSKKRILALWETRFARNDGRVTTDELEALGQGEFFGFGYREALRLATRKDCKLRELHLPSITGSAASLVRVLEDELAKICREEKINRAVIRTALRGDNLNDLEDRVNAASGIKREILVIKNTGEIRFLAENPAAAELQRATQEWKQDDGSGKSLQDKVLDYFAGKTGEVSWNDVCDDGMGVSSYNYLFKQFGGEAWCIYLATDPGSRIGKLTLGKVEREGAVIANIKKALTRDGEIHEFVLDILNDTDRIYDEITNSSWYSRCKHRLVKRNGGLAFVNGVTPAARNIVVHGAPGQAVDEALLEKLEKDFGKSEAKNFLPLVSIANGTRVDGMPTIYAYQFFNDCDRSQNGKKPEDVVNMDLCIINEVLDPAEAGFGKDDLVLKATCYYKKGLYADRSRTPDTRNYFTHSWLKDVNRAKEETVEVKTTIVRPKDITFDSSFGVPSSVIFHDPLAGGAQAGAYLSPQNLIFKIKDGASAWFISEFDPTDKAYNPNGVAFPAGVGKRRLAIHWTFTEDDDDAKLHKAALEDARKGGPENILPWQFSPNAGERDTSELEKYLNEKKLAKAKAEAEARKAKLKTDLETSVRTGVPYDLDGMMPTDEVLDEAEAIGWVEFSIERLDPALLENALKQRISEGKPVDRWTFRRDLNDDRVWETFTAFRDEINKAFNAEHLGLFLNLDRDDGRIWVSDRDESSDRHPTELPDLEHDGGTLKWTAELRRWWRNPQNKVSTFAEALAENEEIKEVDFSRLYGNLMRPQAFMENDELHRYRTKEGLKELAKASGVKFTLVAKNIRELMDALSALKSDDGIGLFDGIGGMSGAIWKVVATAQGNPFAKEDADGNVRLLWNGYAREVLTEAINAAPEDKADRFKVFADAVALAKTSDGKVADTVDFAIGDWSEIHDAVRERQIWEALRTKFGDRGFRVRYFNDRVLKGSGVFAMLTGRVNHAGWKATREYVDSDVVVQIDIPAGVPEAHAGGEPEAIDVGEAFSGIYNFRTEGSILQYNDEVTRCFENSTTLKDFLEVVRAQAPEVRGINVVLNGDKLDLNTFLGYKGWFFSIEDSANCKVEDVKRVESEGRVRVLKEEGDRIAFYVIP